MRKINYDREEIEQTIDRIVERTQRMDLMWDLSLIHISRAHET